MGSWDILVWAGCWGCGLGIIVCYVFFQRFWGVKFNIKKEDGKKHDVEKDGFPLDGVIFLNNFLATGLGITPLKNGDWKTTFLFRR